MRRLLPLLLVAVLVLPGCYHARVETGRPASATVVDKPWASGFIAGLIPPPEVNVESECPNGVSVVETEHSFLNLLVQGLTFSLYSPMHIKVTCAAAGNAAAGVEAGTETAQQAVPTSAAASLQ